jgi:hypothetical protein
MSSKQSEDFFGDGWYMCLGGFYPGKKERERENEIGAGERERERERLQNQQPPPSNPRTTLNHPENWKASEESDFLDAIADAVTRADPAPQSRGPLTSVQR